MEVTDSTILTTTQPNYLSLLREIDKLLHLSFNSPDTLEDTQKISEIEAIFSLITENIERISKQMAFQKNAMFIITILNTIMRISAMDGSDIIISRDPFQLVFQKLEHHVAAIYQREDFLSICATDMLNSMVSNLIKDGFVDICFKRLLSNTTVLFKDCVTTNEAPLEAKRIDFRKLVEAYITYATGFVSYVNFWSYEFRNNYSSLMISMQELINNYLINPNEDASPLLLRVITSILGLVWNLSDKIPLIPILIELDYVKKVIEWIRTRTFSSHINVLGRPIVSIVHNLSRDKTGLKQLRAENAFDVLMGCKPLINKLNDIDLTNYFGYALIALATSDDQPEENKRLILDASEALYQLCTEVNQDLKSKCDCFHLSELLELLHRAFTNTYVIKHILENKANEKETPIQYFAQLFLSIYGVLLDPEPDELEKRAGKYLLKVLLQISSYPEYLKELINNNQFCIIIESLASRPKRDDAKRIWCNIQQITSPNTVRNEMQSIIYVSYDSTGKQFCQEFVKELRSKIAIPIWVDYENVDLSDEMWEYVSPIIRSATVVIILVSPTYEESTDKFQELSYIVATNNSRDEKKGLVVVPIERNLDFKRSWMKDLLHDKTLIPYDINMGHVASNVSAQISVSKKPFIKCLSGRFKNVRKKTTESEDSSANSHSRILKSVPATHSSAVVSIKDYVPKGSPNTAEDTEVLLAPRKHSLYPIAAALTMQTGSAGDLT